MANTRSRRPIIVEDQWTCILSASPKQVQSGDEVTFTVNLSHPSIQSRNNYIDSIPGITPSQISDFYSLFNYTYDSGDPRLEIQNGNPALIDSLPSLPLGKYTISVTVTAAAPTDGATSPITRWFEENQSLATPSGVTRDEWIDIGQSLLSQATGDQPPHNSTEITVVTVTIKTQSDVTLQRTFIGPTKDRALWPAIRNRTAAIGFDRYKAFINCVFCENVPPDPFDDAWNKAVSYVDDDCLDKDKPADQKQRLSIYGPYAYSVLKLATQVFLILESGVVIRDNTAGKPEIFDIEKEQIRVNDFSLSLPILKDRLTAYLAPADGNLPYLGRVIRNLITLDKRDIRKEVLPYCIGVLQHRLTSPGLIELIWSYWLEEGMLVQTMNAIARRFQNRRGSPNDPLGELEFDPLRPLNNLIWGFIQDEHNRLTVPRRAHEYLHHYGLSLVGKAVPDLNPADSRSKFIEAFHNLLSAAARFFKEDSDTTVIADGFPLLNALKEVHLILAEGAHNQFGDLTWTARAEMMTIQWMLARPEMREFLRGRYMVPYQEEWMGAVDSMKKLQGWTDTTVTHFYELAVTGERILLSIRYGDWSDIENIEDQARTWARSNKPEIQRYVHGYRTVTGVDLAADIVDTRDAATRYLQPSVLLQRRLAEQRSAMMSLPSSNGPSLVAARVSGTALPRAGRPRLPVYREEP
jgi:hypothetical protein